VVSVVRIVLGESSGVGLFFLPQARLRIPALLADAGVTPWIARTPAGREIFFAPQDAPLARRVTCDAGLGLAMMMVDHADRLKICAAADCANVFVDESRNRSRRWCSARCSGRINVAAFRTRQRAEPTALASRPGQPHPGTAEPAAPRYGRTGRTPVRPNHRTPITPITPITASCRRPSGRGRAR
jgi:CGNR zinc finger